MTQAAASPTLVVLWRVTERCNLACGFCAYDRALRRSRREVPAHAVRAFGDVLARYRNDTGRRILVSWLGGEPLLWAPLAEISRYYRQHPIELSLTTNGTQLDRPELRALILDQYSEITLSVDGFAPAHDVLRGRSGLFASLARNVTQLADSKRRADTGPLLRANVVLMRQNIASFALLCNTLARWGIEEITFNQLGGNDRPEFFPLHRLLPQQVANFAAAMPELRLALARQGVTLRGNSDYLHRLAATSSRQPLAPLDCAPGCSFLYINEDCVAAPCSFTAAEYGVALEEIDSPEAVAALPTRFAAMRRHAPTRNCADCHSTQHFGKFAVVSP